MSHWCARSCQRRALPRPADLHDFFEQSTPRPQSSAYALPVHCHDAGFWTLILPDATFFELYSTGGGFVKAIVLSARRTRVLNTRTSPSRSYVPAKCCSGEGVRTESSRSSGFVWHPRRADSLPHIREAMLRRIAPDWPGCQEPCVGQKVVLRRALLVANVQRASPGRKSRGNTMAMLPRGMTRGMSASVKFMLSG